MNWQLTEQIEERRKLRNRIENEARVDIKLKDYEAEKRAIEIDRDLEYARIDQTRAIEIRKAEQAAQIEAEKSRLAKEREEIELAKSAKSKDGFTPEDYDAVAEKFAAEGQDELATQARAEAAQLRHKAHVGKLTQAHNASLKTLVEKYPDLKNPESSLYKRVDQTLKSRPALFTYAEGISDAIEACAAHESATRATQLEKELADVKQRLADTEKKLHPTSGGPSSLSAGDGSFNRLPADRQFAELRKQAMAADRAGENFLG
jgi:hypothetical protein